MNEWIKFNDRKPTTEDGDQFGAILTRDSDGHVYTWKWDSPEPKIMLTGRFLESWMKIPQ